MQGFQASPAGQEIPLNISFMSLQGQSPFQNLQMQCNACHKAFGLEGNVPIRLDCKHIICDECCKKQIQNQTKITCPNDNLEHQIRLDQLYLKVEYNIMTFLEQKQLQEQNLKQELIQQIVQKMVLFQQKKNEIVQKTQENIQKRDSLIQI